MTELSELLEKDMVAEPSKVAKVEVLPASEIFGKMARNPDRKMIRVTCENGANVVTALPAGLEYTNGTWHVSNESLCVRSMRNPQSKLAAWIKRYHGEPVVGQDVVTYIDDTGFFRVEL
jgi:hypothetical protein